jgi:hypothetical protein
MTAPTRRDVARRLAPVFAAMLADVEETRTAAAAAVTGDDERHAGTQVAVPRPAHRHDRPPMAATA